MLRAFRNLLSSSIRSDPGTILVTVDRWTLAEELWSFGEDALYLAPLEISDGDMIRVWRLAGKLYWRGNARSAGEAAALAAISVLGNTRPLARKRRRPRNQLPRFAQTPEERLADIHRIEDSEDFPETWR